MSEQSSFYLTLTSDSSLKDYPENKTSTFTVNLPKSIMLNGSWEMALVEFSYPHTIENVTRHNNKLIYEYKKIEGDGVAHVQKFSIEIPIGHYRSVAEIVNTLNFTISTHNVLKEIVNNKDLFKISKINGKIECDSIICDSIVKHINQRERDFKSDILIAPHRLYLEGFLAVLLGFNPFEHNLLEKNIGEHLPNEKLGISSKMLIYCDIIEPQVIGHTKAQVLKTMSTLPPGVVYGDSCEKYFTTLQYVDVMTTCFDSINIDIRTVKGNLMPFSFGSSTALVHLRPKKSGTLSNSK